MDDESTRHIACQCATLGCVRSTSIPKGVGRDNRGREGGQVRNRDRPTQNRGNHKPDKEKG